MKRLKEPQWEEDLPRAKAVTKGANECCPVRRWGHPFGMGRHLASQSSHQAGEERNIRTGTKNRKKGTYVDGSRGSLAVEPKRPGFRNCTIVQVKDHQRDSANKASDERI